MNPLERYNVHVIEMYETLGMLDNAISWLWTDKAMREQGEY
jgi:hypothetical protein